MEAFQWSRDFNCSLTEFFYCTLVSWTPGQAGVRSPVIAAAVFVAGIYTEINK